MTYGYAEYSKIKQLLDKYHVAFVTPEDYELYIKDLLEILKL